MAGERHGVASWPGVGSVASCSYTTSHGISPGSAVLQILPQATYPAETGTLIIGDGVGAITLPDCKINALTVKRDESGMIWSFQIVDRRWKWRDLGQVSGAYNQLDPHAKLIPWTIRSPIELAKLCLDAMGEAGYSIDLPPGLTKRDGENHGQRNPPWIGVIPTTGTNPLINWEQEPPAIALQRLCEYFGRRVIYRWKSDSILIAIPGRGGSLPDGSIARESPSIKSPEVPSGVGVIGAPTKYQARFRLEAVGEEWDGSYRALDQLSYAPLAAGKVAIIKCAAVATGSNTFRVTIDPGSEIGIATLGATFATTTASASTAASNLATAINASLDPRVKGVVTAAAVGAELTITGVKVGEKIGVWARVDQPVTNEASFCAELIQEARNEGIDWRYCVPPLFDGVRATDRLTLVDAMRLAQKSVYRTYRLSDVGFDRGFHPRTLDDLRRFGFHAPARRRRSRPIIVPGYGPLKRRQQLILLPTKVEQVKPQPLDEQLQNALGQSIILNLYDGYSRDMPAVCYGSVAVLRTAGAFAFWTPNFNTENSFEWDQIFVDFAIDPEQQLVIFSAPVFKTRGSEFLPAEPILETGVHVRDAETNAVDCFKSAILLPGQSGSTNFAFRKYLDVQLNVIADYKKQHVLVNGQMIEVVTNILDRVRLLEADAIMRAKFYREGLAFQFLRSAGLTREYNGIVPIDLDGAISQVSWNVGGSGASTIASANTEHAIWFPPYPARRRAEFLGPAQQARMVQNPRLNPWLPNNPFMPE